jgi:tetratricopeptide (TPR) repeat protein
VSNAHEKVVSPALAKAIESLAVSTDTALKRSFLLLKALSLFPQGEQLSRIKRFQSAAPFFPAHATELRDQAFIEVTTTPGLDIGEGVRSARTLVVPRPVREFVRDQMTLTETRRLNHRAADLYFGEDWHSGIFKFPTAYKFSSPHCGSADIANAAAIIIRLLRETIESLEKNEIERVLALAEFYLRALIDGNHYQGAATFCEDLVPLIPPADFDDKRAIIKGLQGRSLRMMGEHARAKSIFLEVSDYPFTASEKQLILLSLALCLQSLEEFSEATAVAEKAVKLNRHSNVAIQARALIVEMDNKDPERTEKLIRLELGARKKGAIVAANNLALLRAREAGKDADRVREILRPVAESTKDFYNRTRAILKLAALSLDANEKLSDVELLHLVGAYHFLFNERMSGLFDECHDALWRVFMKDNDSTNLLTLFRYSSLYWRLSGRDVKETSYLEKLSNIVSKLISDKVSNLSREAAYYLVRAKSVGQTSSKATE